jgi:uncharacterized protein
MTNPSPAIPLVQRLYGAFAARDAAAIRDIFHPDIEWIQNDGFPNGGRHVGAETVLNEVFPRFRTEWSEWRVTIDEYLDASPTVIALGHYHGTHKATGRSMKAAFAHLYDVRDGRIVRFRQYTDTLMVVRAMRG